MPNPEDRPDPRRWMQNLAPPPAKKAKETAEIDPARANKQTMMARLSSFFRRQKADVPLRSANAPPPEPAGRIRVPGAIAEKTFDVPRYRSLMSAGECVESCPMEITVAYKRSGSQFMLIFLWKDADAPDETRHKTDFTEDESYIRRVYDLVVRSTHAPRKLAEEIARARKKGTSEADGVLKALIDMETKPAWDSVYDKPGGI